MKRLLTGLLIGLTSLTTNDCKEEKIIHPGQKKVVFIHGMKLFEQVGNLYPYDGTETKKAFAERTVERAIKEVEKYAKENNLIVLDHRAYFAGDMEEITKKVIEKITKEVRK